MRHLSFVFSLILLVSLVGCSRGPADKILTAEIQQRLDQQFSDNLFQIKSLSRKGSAPRLDGVDGIYVYYNVELEFLRDYNLISWHGLNVGTLAAVLGSTTKGIEGFNKSGNKKGESLFIRGRMAYQQKDDGWVAVTHVPIQVEQVAAQVKTLDTPSPDAVIDSIRDLISHNIDAGRSEQNRVTLRELQRSLARIDLGHADIDGYYTFGTGWPTGSYYKFGEAFTAYANKQDFKVFNYSSEGSLENGYRLQTSRIDFSLLQSDVAEVLYKGWIEEGQLPSPDLRAIASLWPEAVHVITLEKSGIRTFEDIEGKRIAIGSIRSGTRFTAARIWLEAGFERLSTSNVKMFGRGNSIRALENDEVDVIVIVGVVPDPAIQALAQRRSDIRFIPLKQSIITGLAEKNFAYYGQPIPAKTYPGQTESVLTLGMAALLTTSINTPEKIVRRVMQLIRDGSEEISRSFYRAGFITDKTVRLGISMPLHPGAKKFYEELHLEKIEALQLKKMQLENAPTTDHSQEIAVQEEDG